jgi:hypothetical protein
MIRGVVPQSEFLAAPRANDQIWFPRDGLLSRQNAAEHWHVMPRVLDRRAAAEAAAMLADDAPSWGITMRSAHGFGLRPARGQAPAWISTGRPTAREATE